MAQISITITILDANFPDYRDTLAVAYGYQATISDGQGGTIPNPQTKGLFVIAQAKADLRRLLDEKYQIRKRVEAAQVADAIARTVTDTNT
ncbi:MAG: hypothetical protein KW793_03475 [Candidatus Doudnabacteria bacterium]|nr:hypothetical protein [Candidatus Doudnabacteria bacterium]